MKFLAIVAAALVTAAAATPVPASAGTPPQRWHSPGHGHGTRWKTVCKVRWHHGRKIRTCRRVRVRW